MLGGILAAALAAISLDGVKGSGLRAQATFDANNVNVGDPLALTVDFIGTADFESLHPPRLAREVDAKTWKVDDASARTETYRNARRLSYRVRPMREGLLEFPALEFSYMSSADTNKLLTVRTAAVPVHAKPGDRVALAALDGGDGTSMPMPDGIICTIPPERGPVDDDTLFAWRKACASPVAAAFAQFPWPEARLNEAACEIVAGNWAKALRIYSLLEWKIGQTPAVERGIVAALARKTGDPEAELPMWRQTLRPVLAYGWAGRAALFFAALAALAAVLFGLRKLVRAFACVAVFALAGAAYAQMPSLPFEELDKEFEEMQRRVRGSMQQMQQMHFSSSSSGGGGFSFSFGGEPVQKPNISARVYPDRESIVAGDVFAFIIEIEAPKNCTVENVNFAPSQTVGLSAAGDPSNLEDAKAADTNNVVRRISVPVRYDAPFKGGVSFTVNGRYTVSTRSSRRGFSSFSSTVSSDFSVPVPAVRMEVKPLPSQNQPKDFSGAVGTGFRLSQRADRYVVETNDVVSIVWTLEYDGYVPDDALPEAIDRSKGRLAGKKYEVADGRKSTKPLSIVYYDTREKKYKTVTARGMALQYRAAKESGAETVVVGSDAKTDGSRARVLRFAPSSSSFAVAVSPIVPGVEPRTTDVSGDWVRIDDGSHAGWIRKEDLK